MKHEIIGEGTYGCVTKPSLPCKDKSASSKKLTKIMTKENAIDEYKEMLKVTKHPGIEKYVISMPEICKPKINDVFLKTVEQCENEKFPLLNPDDFRMLIVDDGGVSLKEIEEIFFKTMSKNDVHIFLTRVHGLLEGLLFFNEKGIIHHDIKRRNIVYNIETGKIRFIDFGLMKTYNDMIRESRGDNNDMAQKWENFPPEYDCANYSDYKNCDYNMEYNDFIERLTTTFDWYSFGIMMHPLIVTLFKLRKLSTQQAQELAGYFKFMGDPNIEERDYKLKAMVKKYKEILVKYGLWSKSSPTPSKKNVKLQVKLEKTLELSAQEKATIIKALRKRKECKEGYIRDKRTRRCLKKCKKGQIRNSATKRCRKVKK